MTYQITKVSQPVGHAFQVSATDERGVGHVVAEIKFYNQDRDMAILAGRAARAMVEGMAHVWRLTPDGPRQPELRVDAEGNTIWGSGKGEPPRRKDIERFAREHGIPAKFFDDGTYTINEVRAVEGLPPLVMEPAQRTAFVPNKAKAAPKARKVSRPLKSAIKGGGSRASEPFTLPHSD